LESPVADDADAESRSIRGAGVRIAGYGAGTALTGLVSIVLLRYLHPVSFGRYVTVIALIGIVAEIVEAGLGIVGQRRYFVEPDPARRETLIGTLLLIRTVLAAAGAAAALGFGLLAGYPRPMIAGIAIAGAGLLVSSAGITLTTPLYAELRFPALTLIDLVRQGVVLGWIIVVVILGGGLVSVFVSQPAAGIATSLLTFFLVRPRARTRLGVRPDEVRSVLNESLTVAVSQAVNVIYERGLVILMSLVASATATGLFAASYRITVTFLTIPPIVLAVAFPLLARAGAKGASRLSFHLARLAESALLLGILLALIMITAARPLVHLLGGHAYRGVVPILRIQAVMLVPAFLTQVWGYGLLAARRERALAVLEVTGLVSLVAVAIPLIDALGAKGAALAALIIETLFVLVALVAPTHVRPGVRLRPSRALRMLLAGALAGSLALTTGLPDAFAAALSGAVYLVLVSLFRAVPAQLLDAAGSAVRWRGKPRTGTRDFESADTKP
jgi:O-antigen/teichoic acid export membrane protein